MSGVDVFVLGLEFGVGAAVGWFLVDAVVCGAAVLVGLAAAAVAELVGGRR